MEGIRDGIRKRLEQELQTVVSRLRSPGGAVALAERPGAIGSTCHFADEGDAIQASESREIGFATHELLLTRVKRLSAALAQLDEGEYGTELISPARLHAMPEVQCCVRCQDRLERHGRRP